MHRNRCTVLQIFSFRFLLDILWTLIYLKMECNFSVCQNGFCGKGNPYPRGKRRSSNSKILGNINFENSGCIIREN